MNRQFNSDRHVRELDILDRSFLTDLLPFTKKYSYDGELQLLDIIDSETVKEIDCFLLCSGKEKIETIVDSRSTTSIPISISSFDINEGLLLVKMPSRTHAVAADEINYLIREKLTPMGLNKAINGFPGATIVGKTSTRGKEPDYGWCPKRRPRPSGPAVLKMPSVVIEVAYTETDKKLNQDVRYWLSPNDGNANMCLTIRVNRKNNEIRLESWMRQEPHADNNNSTRIYRNQAIHARMRAQAPPIVTGDYPFRIPFESLMLRPIDSARATESNLMFSKEDLESVFESIWNAEWEE